MAVGGSPRKAILSDDSVSLCTETEALAMLAAEETGNNGYALALGRKTSETNNRVVFKVEGSTATTASGPYTDSSLNLAASATKLVAGGATYYLVCTLKVVTRQALHPLKLQITTQRLRLDLPSRLQPRMVSIILVYPELTKNSQIHTNYIPNQYVSGLIENHLPILKGSHEESTNCPYLIKQKKY